MNKKYEVQLQPEEREQIHQLLHADSTSPGIRRRCLVLLLADESQGAIPTQAEMAQRCGINEATVSNTIKDCTCGLEETLRYRKRAEPPRPSPVTREVEARIIALACSEPPEGYARWTVRLLTHRYSGKSRQGAPVRATHSMAFSIWRWSLGDLPPCGFFSGGSRSLNFSHWSSRISYRLIILTITRFLQNHSLHTRP